MPRIIGYAYKGALYCADCFGDCPECDLAPAYHTSDDNHGYGPNPVFSTDEGEFYCDACFEEF